MKFLAMLAALLIHGRRHPPPLTWPARWQPRPGPGFWPPLAASLGPALGAAALLWLVGTWLWGLVGLALHLVVLIGCLGGTPWRRLLDTLAAEGQRGDLQAVLLNLDQEGIAVAATEAEALPMAVSDSLALRGVREGFAVLFWFVLLGAPGALLYRCSERVVAAGGGGWLLALLEWPALRAFGLLTALAGHPGRALGAWFETLLAALPPARRAGQAVAVAIDPPPAALPPGVELTARVRGLQALLGRALLVWVALVAVVWILL